MSAKPQNRLLLLALPLAALVLAGCNSKQARSHSRARPAYEANLAPGVQSSVNRALDWLAEHQSDAGFWDSDAFMKEDRFPGESASDGKGNPFNDVGVTGLALLAFVEAGNTPNSGRFARNVARAVNWLTENQTRRGLYGEELGNSTIYNHGIATAAMARALGSSVDQPKLRKSVEKAVRVIEGARNSQGAWRYSLDPNGDNDTVVTGWMLMALNMAEDAGIVIDPAATWEPLTWLSGMTNLETGRTGYASPSSGPNRPAAIRDRFPAEKSEAPTAVALLCRIRNGADFDNFRFWSDHPQTILMQMQVDLLLEKPPLWNEIDGTIDFYYWMWGTYALNEWGAEAWQSWKLATARALLPYQRTDGNFSGSWDPADPWSQDGGRVYATAVCALILEEWGREPRFPLSETTTP